MPTGRIKFFATERGFGFVTPDHGGPDVFLHITTAQAAGLFAPVEGMSVGYEFEIDHRGRRRAIQVRRL